VFVAVVIVLMVEMRGNDVVDMIAMGNGLVAAIFAVAMALGMSVACVRPIAGVRLPLPDCEHVLVHVIAVHVVEVSFVNEVDVAVVENLCVPAAVAVLVLMVGMNIMPHTPK